MSGTPAPSGARPTPAGPDPRFDPPPPLKQVCPLSDADLVSRIMEFIQEISGVRFYAYQYVFCRRIVESVILNDGDTVTGLWARQSGKTESVANLGFGLCVILPALANTFPDDKRLGMFRRGFWIGVFAPILEQATISFSRMRALSLKPTVVAFLADEELNVSIVTNRGDTLAFSNGSFIQARSASPDSQIEGKTFHLVMLEEAQRLSQAKVEKEILPMLAAVNGSMVKIGTAWTARGGFHTTIQQNLALWKVTGKRNHFEFPYDIVIAEKQKMYEKDGDPTHLLYGKYVKSVIKKLGGTNSLEFKMNFMCLWHESRVIAVDPEHFKTLGLDNVEAMPLVHGFQVAGLDIGKMHDSTVLTVGHVDLDHPIINRVVIDGAEDEQQIYYRKTILDWLVMEGAFEGREGQYATLVDYLRHTSVKILCVDTTGMGDPFFERLEMMIGDSIILIPMTFALPNKSRLYKYYLQEINQGRILYPAGPITREELKFKRFVQEHEDLERQHIGNFVTCAHPEGDYHDDFPDSAALMAWAEHEAPNVRVPEVQVSMLDDLKFVDSIPRQQENGYSSRDSRYRSGRSRRMR